MVQDPFYLDMPFDNTCMQRKLQSDCGPINARGIHQEIGREGEKALVVSWRMPVALKWILYVFFPKTHSKLWKVTSVNQQIPRDQNKKGTTTVASVWGTGAGEVITPQSREAA